MKEMSRQVEFQRVINDTSARRRRFPRSIFIFLFAFSVLCLIYFAVLLNTSDRGDRENKTIDETSRDVRYTVLDGEVRTEILPSDVGAGMGSEADSKQTETVQDEPKPAEVKKTGKVIYLTFDDGPSEHTARLLDVLKKYDVKATFFVTCRQEKYRDLVKRASEEGHAIGLHSCTHNYASVYASKEAFMKELNDISDVVFRMTGKRTNLVRFPGGSSNTVSRKYKKGIMTQLVNDLEKDGYVYFDWNVVSGDTDGARTREEVARNVTSTLKNDYSIVLQHDIKGFSIDAVEDIIKYGIENGYTFLALDEKSPTAHHKVNN
jgi:peptidoglycan/xylan/chitin deacetylase (PgdA/CDA1 family)